MSFAEKTKLLFSNAKSPIPARKRKIFADADKAIQEQDALKTERSKAIEQATGVESDPERSKREIARKARRTLMGY
jgi:hypothetical protein